MYTKWFLIGNIAGAAWLGLWLSGFGREMWDAVDRLVFWTLNGTLSGDNAWTRFWAFANWRPFDAVAQLAIIIPAYLWYREAEEGRGRLHIFGFWLFFFLTNVGIVIYHQFFDAFSFLRQSPTLELEGAYRLSALSGWSGTKDFSEHCFPGDHAYTLLMLVCFCAIYASRRVTIVAALVLFPFMLPRLVGGAHWFTDVAVGGVSMTLFGLSWLVALPTHRLATRVLMKLANPILDLPGKLKARLRQRSYSAPQ